MPMNTNRLTDRLSRRLSDLGTPALPAPQGTGLAPFRSRRELQEHLSEGALLNVSVLASRALSVPSGEYMIWSTDLGHTILIPTAAVERPDDVVTKESPTIEVHTNKLLGSWNRLERTIAEADEGEGGGGEVGSGKGFMADKQHFQDAPEEQPDQPYTFGSDVGRTKLWQAMRRVNMGVNDLAAKVGVDPSTISRLLRNLKGGAGDPGGRNPSVALAAKIASVLGCDIDQVIPPAHDLEIAKRTGTAGSGRGGTNKRGRRGSGDYTKGNTSESVTVDELLDDSRNLAREQDDTTRLIFHTARLMGEMHINPFEYLSEQINRRIDDRLLGLQLKGALGRARLTLGEARGSQGHFDSALKALKQLYGTYGQRGYTVRQGKNKYKIGNFLQNIYSNLLNIRDNMPEVERRHGDAPPAGPLERVRQRWQQYKQGQQQKQQEDEQEAHRKAAEADDYAQLHQHGNMDDPMSYDLGYEEYARGQKEQAAEEDRQQRIEQERRKKEQEQIKWEWPDEDLELDDAGISYQ